MKRKIEVSIIILNWNGKHWLKECLCSVYKQGFKNFEVILADNNSNDGSVRYVKQNWPRVKILSLAKNFGYTGANNRAAKIAQGKYLLFLNNDTKISPNFLMEIYRYTKERDAVLLTPRVFDYDGSEIFPKGKKYLGIDRYGYPGPSKCPFYADGAAFFIKKLIFDRLGGFDDDYFIFQEDVDLSWRVRLLGYEVIPIESAKVFHSCGGTVIGAKKRKGRHKTSIFRRYLTERNALSNLLKNYKGKSLIWSVPIFLLLGWGEAFLYFLTGRFSGAIAILKAHSWNFINIRKTLSKRKKIQKTRKISDKQIIKSMLKGSMKWKAFKTVGIPKFE